MNPVYRLLLLSSSRTAKTGFLQHARQDIDRFLNGEVKHAVFLPYASVRSSYDEYTGRVQDWFGQLGCEVHGLHRAADFVQELSAADLIIGGGGNTFHLLHELYRHDLIGALRRRISEGIHYLGWSAGSNIACPSIRTTNDMPIIWPPSCEALDLVPFQINPHYTDTHLTGHQGETRAERLSEFMVLNPDIPVVALREGSALQIEAGKIRLLGEHTARISRGERNWEAAPGSWGAEMLQHAVA
jgi:dipeptidase E